MPFKPHTHHSMPLTPRRAVQYLTAPAEDVSETQGGDHPDQGDDGDKLKVLRPSKDKLCFPAVCIDNSNPAPSPNLPMHGCTSCISARASPWQFPFLMPRLGAFRVVTNTQGVDLYGLTYERWCTLMHANRTHWHSHVHGLPAVHALLTSRKPSLAAQARTTALCNRRRASSTASASTRRPRIRFFPTRPCCARPRPSTPSPTPGARASAPSRPRPAPAILCAPSSSWEESVRSTPRHLSHTHLFLTRLLRCLAVYVLWIVVIAIILLAFLP